MAYDEALAARIRELVAGEQDLTEQKMFGGLAFLVGGNMAIAASGQGGALVRVDPAETEKLLASTHAQPFEMRGRSMNGWLRVDTEHLRTKPQLAKWAELGVGLRPLVACEALGGRMLRAEVGGLSIAYRQAGHGPALVLLHGFLFDSRAWRPQLESLSTDFTVIAWDAPGAGESGDPPETFRLADWADCLAGLLDAAGVESADVAGVSWGGILAQELYRGNPSAFARSRWPAPTPAGARRSVRRAPKSGWRPAFATRRVTPMRSSRSTCRRCSASRRPRRCATSWPTSSPASTPPASGSMARASAQADMRELLSRIRAPTLLVWGEEDARSPLSVAHELHAAIAGSRLAVIPGAGHLSNFDAPARFNAEVRGVPPGLRPGRPTISG